MECESSTLNARISSKGCSGRCQIISFYESGNVLGSIRHYSVSASSDAPSLKDHNLQVQSFNQTITENLCSKYYLLEIYKWTIKVLKLVKSTISYKEAEKDLPDFI